jgi:hypothetical protein
MVAMSARKNASVTPVTTVIPPDDGDGVVERPRN